MAATLILVETSNHASMHADLVSTVSRNAWRDPMLLEPGSYPRQVRTFELLAALPVLAGIGCLMLALLTSGSTLTTAAYLACAVAAFGVAANWTRQLRDSPCMREI